MSANWTRAAAGPRARSSAAVLASGGPNSVGPQRLLERGDLGLGEHDERRLVRGDAVAQELQEAVDEPALAGVHQRLVSEGRERQGGSTRLPLRCPVSTPLMRPNGWCCAPG